MHLLLLMASKVPLSLANSGYYSNVGYTFVNHKL